MDEHATIAAPQRVDAAVTATDHARAGAEEATADQLAAELAVEQAHVDLVYAALDQASARARSAMTCAPPRCHSSWERRSASWVDSSSPARR